MSKLDTYSNMGQKYHVQDQRLQVSNMDDLQVPTWLEGIMNFLPAFQRKSYNAVYVPSLT